MAKPCSCVVCLDLLSALLYPPYALAGAHRHLVIFSDFAALIENLFSFSFGIFVFFKICTNDVIILNILPVSILIESILIPHNLFLYQQLK